MTGLEVERLPAEDPEVAVVELRGEIDLTNAAELSERLAELADAPLLVLDLNRVSFVDSAALHSLFRLARERGAARLVLAVDPSSPIFRTFEIVQLGRAALVVSSVEDAIGRVQSG